MIISTARRPHYRVLAGEETEERAPLVRDLIANRSAQHRIPRLERVENCARRRGAIDAQLHLAAHAGEGAQMLRQDDPDHVSVCTSTDSTAGRSRTIGFQLSPASTEAYTCPPVVPKYTPHASSESTAIASRSTFT